MYVLLQVEQALLVMAYNDGSKADLFHMNEERCDFYWKLWLERLNTYHMRVREESEFHIIFGVRSKSKGTFEVFNITFLPVL